MIRGYRNVWLVGAVLLAVGCASHGRTEQILREPAVTNVAALVDSEPAQRLLIDLLERRTPDARLATLAPSFRGADVVPDHEARPRPDPARLRDLAREVSLDFAALTFAREISADQRSRAVQAAFDRFLEAGRAGAEEALKRPGGFPYTVLFAPSWLYRSHPETGSDFAHQRWLLDRLGIANRLIESGESATVEDNAAVIAATVRAAPRDGTRLILVSASKSGAEVALALSRLLAPEEAAGVAAWVNIVGALGGTPLVDAATRPPVSWLVRAVCWLARWNWDGLISMATGPSRKRLEGATLPGAITVVNVVAVPVSGSVGPEVFFGYQTLRDHGPSDGVVLLADTVWPGGANLVTLGPDHLFAPRWDDLHGMALLETVDFAVRSHGAGLPAPVAAGEPERPQRSEAGALDPP
ncbi:MAG: hypothetical protein ACREM3_21835 [Candidatus Rokuibacteriota bacterium]